MRNMLSAEDIEEMRKICAVLHHFRQECCQNQANNMSILFDNFLMDPIKYYTQMSLQVHPDKMPYLPKAYFNNITAYQELARKNLNQKKIIQASIQYLITNQFPNDVNAVDRAAIERLVTNREALEALANTEITKNSDAIQAHKQMTAEQARLEQIRLEERERLKEQQMKPLEQRKQEKKEKEEALKLRRLELESQQELKRIMDSVTVTDSKKHQAAALLCNLQKIAATNGFIEDFNLFLKNPTEQQYYDKIIGKLNPTGKKRLSGSTAYIEAINYYKAIGMAQNQLQNNPNLSGLSNKEKQQSLETLENLRKFLNENAMTLLDSHISGAEGSIRTIAQRAIEDAERNIEIQNRVLSLSNNPKEMKQIYALISHLHKKIQTVGGEEIAVFFNFLQSPSTDLEKLIKKHAPDMEFAYKKAIDYYQELIYVINNLDAKENLSKEEIEILRQLEELRTDARKYAEGGIEIEIDANLIEELRKIYEARKKEEDFALQLILPTTRNKEKRYEATALLWHLHQSARKDGFKNDFDAFLINPLENHDQLAKRLEKFDNKTAYIAAMNFYRNLAKAVHILESRGNHKLSSELLTDKQRIDLRANSEKDIDFYGKNISERATEAIIKQRVLSISMNPDTLEKMKTSLLTTQNKAIELGQIAEQGFNGFLKDPTNVTYRSLVSHINQQVDITKKNECEEARTYYRDLQTVIHNLHAQQGRSDEDEKTLSSLKFIQDEFKKAAESNKREQEITKAKTATPPAKPILPPGLKSPPKKDANIFPLPIPGLKDIQALDNKSKDLEKFKTKYNNIWHQYSPSSKPGSFGTNKVRSEQIEKLQTAINLIKTSPPPHEQVVNQQKIETLKTLIIEISTELANEKIRWGESRLEKILTELDKDFHNLVQQPALINMKNLLQPIRQQTREPLPHELASSNPFKRGRPPKPS